MCLLFLEREVLMGIGNAFVSILELIYSELQIPLAMLFAVLLAYNGYRMMTGNAQTVEKVKNWVIFAFLALVLILFGQPLANQIISIIKSSTTIG